MIYHHFLTERIIHFNYSFIIIAIYHNVCLYLNSWFNWNLFKTLKILIIPSRCWLIFEENYRLVTNIINGLREPCPEGEKYYGIRYPDAKKAAILGRFESHFAHYQRNWKSRRRRYLFSEYRRYIKDPAESQTESQVSTKT